ncbi:MAG: GGDEF domain-containing protein [Campylobacterales bacterium]|nr:GGDEF domain-containing protein [Campylobacterales bacterium]
MRTQELQKLATVDALTECYNRYAIMEYIQAEINRSKRISKPFSLIMYDLDHFKAINDTYGHDKGDRVLQIVTDIIRHSIREVDLVGRYGGEEFLILMPHTALREAIEIAQRAKEAVANYKFDTIKGVTISLGVIEYQEGEEINSLLKRVDELLYQSKKEGRNRVSY